jgi:hypothetical protein
MPKKPQKKAKASEPKKEERTKRCRRGGKIRDLFASDEYKRFYEEGEQKTGAGRPTDYDGIGGPLCRKLLQCLMMDFTIEESCAVAGICRDTFYLWVKTYPEFSDNVDRAKEFLFAIAKKNVADQLAFRKRFDQSMEFLSKRQRSRYSARSETINKEFHELTPEQQKEIDDVLDAEGL